LAQPYVGEIRMFAGNFEPNGWLFCNGQMLPIAENETLFQLIGTLYGGDGESTFALPDLRGRVPIHLGNFHQLAEWGGTETETLTVNQLPAHSHPLLASSAAGQSGDPAGRVLTRASTGVAYAGGSPMAMAAPPISAAGGSQPHDNMQPYLCVSFIISLFGIFPSQT
jgi:microcystin-dependent protein